MRAVRELEHLPGVELAVHAAEDGRARLRPVQLGHRGRLDVEIAAGRAVGAVVILDPSVASALGSRSSLGGSGEWRT